MRYTALFFITGKRHMVYRMSTTSKRRAYALVHKRSMALAVRYTVRAVKRSIIYDAVMARPS